MCTCTPLGKTITFDPGLVGRAFLLLPAVGVDIFPVLAATVIHRRFYQDLKFYLDKLCPVHFTL